MDASTTTNQVEQPEGFRKCNRVDSIASNTNHIASQPVAFTPFPSMKRTSLFNKVFLLLFFVVCLSSTRHANAETTYRKSLSYETISPSLKNMEYAVRGKVVIEADKMADAGHKIVYTNIGNPQSVGQKPPTWPRQVLALTNLPREVGVDHESIETVFPKDAVARARSILDAVQSIGAYSHSQGVPLLRKDVADFISARDGYPCDMNNIFLTNGASAAIQMVLSAIVAKPERTGIMLPIPQYPIYSATVDLLNGRKVPYYLDEDKDWELNMEELERSYDEAIAGGIDVAVLVLINPGNPTGQVLTKQNVRDIVEFCVRKGIVLMADEVYQENVYQGEFYSCKKAAVDLDLVEQLELFSFHSISKGVFGECGQRGGYMELSGIDQQVHDELYKLASSALCSNLAGQILTSIMCRGPQPGDVSYESHEREKKELYEALKRKSVIVSDGLNTIEGFSCRPAKGSMYCFPQVEMPPAAFQRASELGVSVDTLYCISLLKATGICVVPASGFGQREGRHGFRTTFLPNEDVLRESVAKIQAHYTDFLQGTNY